jgi:Tfp pilus assembly major pilin PilA
MPGTPGANRFGNPTRPGNSGVVWLIAILGFVAIMGILAAIAIPAYNDYLQAAGGAGANQQ